MKKIEPKTILVDFDGTLAFHCWPALGDEVPDAVNVVKRLADAGHKIILFTNRSGRELEDALAFCEHREIPLHAVNENPEFETGSRKIYGHAVIDDHSAYVPLIYNPAIHDKPFVNWQRIKEWLLINNYL
jgi:hypothetical protein